MKHRFLITSLLVLATLASSPSAQAQSSVSIPFDSAKWRHDPDYMGTKTRMVDDLLKGHKLVGLTRKELYSLLGVPGQSFHAYASYSLYQPGAPACGGASLEFACANDIVTKYRVHGSGALLIDPGQSWQSELEKWADSPAESAKDAAAMAAAPPEPGPRKSTVMLPAAPDDDLLRQAEKQWAERDYEGSSRSYSEYLKLFPDEDHIWELRGMADFERGAFADAADAFSHEITLAMLNPRGYENRARAYLRLAQLQKAINDSTQAINILYPPSADSKQRSFMNIGGSELAARFRTARQYTLRAVAYWKDNQKDKAFADIESAISINVPPSWVLPFSVRAEFYRQQGKHDFALADYNKGISELNLSISKIKTAMPIITNQLANIRVPQEALEGRARLYDDLHKPELAATDREAAKTATPSHDGWLMQVLSK